MNGKDNIGPRPVRAPAALGVRRVEALERIAHAMEQLVDNLSPRWVMETDEENDPGMKKGQALLRYLAEVAKPGHVAVFTPEKVELLKRLRRI